MAVSLHRDEVRQLLAHGAQSVEVLPAAEYDDEHLPRRAQRPAQDARARDGHGARPDTARDRLLLGRPLRH